MTAVEVVVAQADREKYAMPEPLLFDLAKFDDLPYSLSGAWEEELLAATGQGIGELFAGLPRGRAKSKRALLWLACLMADVDVPAFTDFDVAWRRVKTLDLPRAARKAGGVEDPSQGSSEPLSAEAP